MAYYHVPSSFLFMTGKNAFIKQYVYEHIVWIIVCRNVIDMKISAQGGREGWSCTGQREGPGR
jgi:hypothetical protein